MNEKLVVLKFLRDAASQLRRRSEAAVAGEALHWEKKLAREVEDLESKLAEGQGQEHERAA